MATLPPDIDATSRFRLPFPKREELDPEARAEYDKLLDPKGGTIRGLHGPAGVRLWSPKAALMSQPINRYLRFEAGFPPRRREVAILATARECDSRFEWAAHEPEALKEGVPKEVVETIKHRRGTAALDAEDRIMIEMAREIFGKRKLSSETFAAALKMFGARKLVDLVSLMGNYAGTAALLTAFDMQLDEGETALLPVP
jgi:4-carboxymuconolactone decarboxylase